MKFPEYTHLELEPHILGYWQKNKIVEKLRAKNAKKPKFYFLQGPPYTSGRIHLGHAWNMGLKDMVLRYKRMQGYNVWDRMGYDMHGLPTEQKVMAKFSLKNKEDIQKFGVKKFAEECRKFCTDMMQGMNTDFLRIGATLDFTNPYQPITQQFMEAEWWLIKQAHAKSRLYQGLRTMHWDAATQTAAAKHELEYKEITDTSIYMKFPHRSRKNTFFIIWTTTPWTIPLNLAIMVNPELYYAEAKVGGETWIIAKDRLQHAMAKAGEEEYTVLKEYLGKELEGQQYDHPLKVKQFLSQELQKNPRLFSVLLSTEYVDATTGTGLVHCAPGCGPEDYEVGHQYHIPPFNCVNEEGVFTNFGSLTGLRAKLDDRKFIDAIERSGALIAKEQYVHEYPHGERSHQPVIFRTTKQWFFKVEDLKEKMLTANEKVYWNPQGGKNAFTSWLENLRDNSITKQRYWGTAVPIWQAEDGDYIVVGSVAELEKLSQMKVKNMHIPDIDQITITKNKKIYRRIPDVLDVWIDAGTVSWNCLDYPQDKRLFATYFPPDFILEGKDQVRGWFNLLMVASFLALDKPAFKNVYMHGFLNDVSGVKMSKSLGNIITPDELLQKHGADVLRCYMCQTTAGEDINFSWDECAVTQRTLFIFWNIHKLLLNLARENECNPFSLKLSAMEKLMNVEEKYIFSKLHSTIQQVTNLMEEYRLDEAIAPLENLFLELSRTYIQLVREKSAVGNAEEKEVCMYTIATILLEGLKMFSVIAPFVTEAMYLNLKERFNLPEESISHYVWPKVNAKKIAKKLERHMESAQQIIQASLSAREKAKLGVRWPVKEIVIVSEQKGLKETIELLKENIATQLNVKSIVLRSTLPGLKATIKPNFGKIGPAYGELSPQIITRLTVDSPETVLSHIEREGSYTFTVEDKNVSITKDMLFIQHIVPQPFIEAEFKQGYIYLNTERTPELETEGYVREVMRQIQQLRKEAGLQKTDAIVLHLKINSALLEGFMKYKKDIQEKVGAKRLDVSQIDSTKKYAHSGAFVIKQEKFSVWFEKV